MDTADILEIPRQSQIDDFATRVSMTLKIEGAEGQSVTNRLLAKEAGLVPGLARTEPVQVEDRQPILQLHLGLIDPDGEVRDLTFTVANRNSAPLRQFVTCLDRFPATLATSRSATEYYGMQGG
jgi:hypothetical protein